MGSEDEDAVLAIFEHADANGDGTLDPKEFEDLMMALDPSLSKGDVAKMKDAADTDKNGRVEVKEFVHWVFTGQSCEGVKSLHSLLHGALHVGGNEDPLSDSDMDMYWSQASKLGMKGKPDGHVSREQMSQFLAKITECEDMSEFEEMWALGTFPFAKGAAVAKVREARDIDEDDELLDKKGFLQVMRDLDF